ncbi:MAG: peptidoglycan/xylan/chitin deacetylase (PgdA/CDA1 family) [Pirellulaceae bacterium]|jgi:peptidoglycan/xylan/chitin deacetylase (PgdA/CDA1 family)
MPLPEVCVPEVSMSVAESRSAQTGIAEYPKDERLEQRLRSMMWKQWLLCKTITPLQAIFSPLRKEAFGIITYHRTAATAANDTGLLNVGPSTFRQQMSGLLKLGYEPWTLRKVVEHQNAGAEIPRNVFVVVFDDGYENNYLYAFPILQELQIPATIFMATAYLDSDQPFPFDDWTAKNYESVSPESWRPLATKQCEAMLASGLVDIGSHTHTHRDFRMAPSEFAADLKTSQETLRAKFGFSDATFSFPYGFLSDDLIDHVRQSTMLCCLSAECTLVTPADDCYHWGRFGATEMDSARTLAAKLDGWYNFIRSGWRRSRGR